MPPMDPKVPKTFENSSRGSEFVASFGQAFDRRVLARNRKRRFFLTFIGGEDWDFFKVIVY